VSKSAASKDLFLFNDDSFGTLFGTKLVRTLTYFLPFPINKMKLSSPSVVFGILLSFSPSLGFVSRHISPFFAAGSSRPSVARNYAINNFDENAIGNGLSALSVTELKRLLSERGVDFRDCLEKSDLIRRLQETQNSPGREASVPTSALSDQEQSLISTFKSVSPAVANIKTSTLIPQQRGLQLQGLEVPSGSGSGFLWDSNGHVVTNYHVITGGRRGGNIPKSVMVKLAGLPETLNAVVVGVEPEKDIAVLKLTDTRNIRLPTPIDVGTSDDLQVGQSVMAIGNPFGLDDTLTTGIVSALGRDIQGIGGRQIHGCIQVSTRVR
jgi:S1-C subfamily serine protease